MGKPHIPRLCFPSFKLTYIRRCRLSRKTLIFGSICAVYLCFVVGRRTNEGGHGLNDLEDNGPLPARADARTGAGTVVPTRSNVVYITLKSKRRKPVHIRGTVRPKVRRKARRNKSENVTFTHNKGALTDVNAGAQHFTTHDFQYKSLAINPESTKDGSEISSIRLYGQKAPPWFSQLDMDTMRFLADAKVLRVRKISHSHLSSSLFVFEGDSNVHSAAQKDSRLSAECACAGQCGLIHSPVDNSEVFAFHLDRVLGLNRTLPAVSRAFSYMHGTCTAQAMKKLSRLQTIENPDGQSCPVVSWDASLFPEAFAAGWATVRLSWREYQSSLKLRCWQKNPSPKPDAGCSTIHHYEWSKLALFDFLLQIHNRLDPSCCGFRPRQEDACVELGHHAECVKQENIQLTNTVHRDQDQRHLVFVNNKGFFDRNEDNLDFRLLEGIKEFPESAVSVLRNQKLREKLLQSLFLDQTYWESQGGRQGIDKLIDVIEKRAKVLLTYINAHGIKVIAMKT